MSEVPLKRPDYYYPSNNDLIAMLLIGMGIGAIGMFMFCMFWP